MTTLIPLFILAALGNPQPEQVRTWLVPHENVVCYQTAERGLCLPYNDEGTHLAIQLNELLHND